jgi:hypothetical protein
MMGRLGRETNVRVGWIWLAALIGYALFSLWYDDWSGPLRADEIDSLLARAQEQAQIEPTRLAAVRAFLEADDGGEFFMLNLLRPYPEPVAAPGSSERKPAREVMEGYTRHFMPALFRRAGHPAWFGRAAGGYVEAWGVERDPGWSMSGVIRYRSRRDMIELATDPAFEPAHAFKIAALERTFAFPLSPAFVVAGPRFGVALLLALGAALAHVAVLHRELRRLRSSNTPVRTARSPST